MSESRKLEVDMDAIRRGQPVCSSASHADSKQPFIIGGGEQQRGGLSFIVAGPRDLLVVANRSEKPPAPDEIVYLKNGLYKIGAWQAILLTTKEDYILRTFLQYGTLDTESLKDRSGYDRAPRDLRELRKKYEGRFAPAISCPGKRGRGGYRVNIRARP